MPGQLIGGGGGTAYP